MQSDRVVLSPPQGAFVFSIFDGFVSDLSASSGSATIKIKNKDNQLAVYFFAGETLVKKGQNVKAGEIIAKIKKTEEVSCLGGNTLQLYLFDIKDVPQQIPFNKQTLLKSAQKKP